MTRDLSFSHIGIFPVSPRPSLLAYYTQSVQCLLIAELSKNDPDIYRYPTSRAYIRPEWEHHFFFSQSDWPIAEAQPQNQSCTHANITLMYMIFQKGGGGGGPDPLSPIWIRTFKSWFCLQPGIPTVYITRLITFDYHFEFITNIRLSNNYYYFFLYLTIDSGCLWMLYESKFLISITLFSSGFTELTNEFQFTQYWNCLRYTNISWL